MNEKQGELTSALLDGEFDGIDHRRAIDGLIEGGRDEMARFGRYRLIGDVMRGESAVVATAVAQRVSTALRSEPTVLAPRRRPAQWLRPVAGLAIAASVAAAAVVIAPQLLTGSPGDGAMVQLASDPPSPATAPALVAAGRSTPPPRTLPVGGDGRWQTLDDELTDRLNRLVIEHHEFGGRTGINGPVSHIGLVSYDGR